MSIHIDKISEIIYSWGLFIFGFSMNFLNIDTTILQINQDVISWVDILALSKEFLQVVSFLLAIIITIRKLKNSSSKKSK